MTWEQLLADVLGAFIQAKFTFSVNGFAVVVSTASGAPARLTFASAIATAEQIFTNGAGTVQVGDVIVTIVRSSNNATDESTALAAAIAPHLSTVGPAAAQVGAARSPVLSQVKPQMITAGPPAATVTSTAGRAAG